MLDPIILLPAAINGLTMGAVYALVALGLTLIYGVLHIINFAHGSLLMVGLYGVFFLYRLFGLDPYACMIVLVPACFAIRYALQRSVIGTVSHGRDQNVLLITLGVSIVLENLALYLFSADTKTIETPYALDVVDLGVALVPLPRLIGFVAALALAAILWALIGRTDLGRAIRAVAKEPHGARLVGIDVEHVYAMSFGIGTACLAVLLSTLTGAAWNVLGGFGGQFSFGHAAFFGAGAYAAAILEMRFGVNAWLAFAAAGVVGGAVGFGIGYLSFRYGLRGSYFALITLAFAEVLRILANAADFTGGGVGLYLPLQVGGAHLQFATKARYDYLALGLGAGAILVGWMLERSRLGAWLVAIRENEDAARALGVDTFAGKLPAIALSGALTGLAGAFYADYYLYIDPGLAFGPGISVEILLAPIIGGIGTVWGPFLGAAALRVAGELARRLMGDAPGLSLIFYGALLVIMVKFLPDGLIGLLDRAVRPRGIHAGGAHA